MAPVSVIARATLAVALMAGFYLLAAAISGGLLWLVYLDLGSGHLHARLILFCLIGAGAILSSVAPRPDRFEEPGPALTSARNPQIYGLIREVATATGQAMPVDVYLIPQMNAWVAQRGGLMGFGSRRVMGIGLPLLQALRRSHLRAVLGHEFGHYARGDTMLGPWIYKTRAAIGRTIQGLSRVSSVLHLPFLWYGRIFLRISQAVSRRQELYADQLACRIFGSRALIEGLRNVHAGSVAFDAYWNSEVAPALNARMRPPLVEGFSRFLKAGSVSGLVEKALAEEMSRGGASAFDTHPPLRDRIAAAERMPPGDPPGEDPLSITLLGDAEEIEVSLLGHAAGLSESWARSLSPVRWEQIGERLYLKAWRDRRYSESLALAGLLVRDLPKVAGDLEGFASKLKAPGRRPASSDEATRLAVTTLGAALGAALADHGWTVQTSPGEPVRLARDGRTLDPVGAVAALAAGRATREQWIDFCASVGIEAIALGEAGGGEGSARIPAGRAQPHA